MGVGVGELPNRLLDDDLDIQFLAQLPLQRLIDRSRLPAPCPQGTPTGPQATCALGLLATSTLPCLQMTPAVARRVGIVLFAIRRGRSSCVPRRRARQLAASAQASQCGWRGRQVVAPRSVDAWLMSPGLPRPSKGSRPVAACARPAASEGIPPRSRASAKHAAQVAVERDFVPIEGDGGDGDCCVATHARKPFQLCSRFRAGGPGGQARPASPAPAGCAPDDSSQVPPRGEAHPRRMPPALAASGGFHPTIVVGNDRFDPRLLQHRFRHQDRVGILAAAPWQVATMAVIPAEQGLRRVGRALILTAQPRVIRCGRPRDPARRQPRLRPRLRATGTCLATVIPLAGDQRQPRPLSCDSTPRCRSATPGARPAPGTRGAAHSPSRRSSHPSPTRPDDGTGPDAVGPDTCAVSALLPPRRIRCALQMPDIVPQPGQVPLLRP